MVTLVAVHDVGAMATMVADVHGVGAMANGSPAVGRSGADDDACGSCTAAARSTFNTANYY